MQATSAEAFNGLRQVIQSRLATLLDDRPARPVNAAAQYVVLTPGHRWRGILALLSGRLFPSIPVEASERFGAALEIFHAASLTLDDLPSMDHATVRRGRPCVHMVQPRWVVDLLPAYLVSIGYEALLDLPGVHPERALAVARRAAGIAQAMTRGQELDLALEAPSLSQLLECHRLKTGLLYAFSASGPARLAGATAAEVEALEGFGETLGLVYQLEDDTWEGEAGLEALGKDGSNGRAPEARLIPESEAGSLRQRLLERCEASLRRFGDAAVPLLEMLPNVSVVR